jgi:hypothetical protein
VLLAPVALMQAGQWAWLTEDPDAPTIHNHVYAYNLIDRIPAVLAAGGSGG